MSVKRGALIVFEGVDRSGKSTQAKALVEGLKKKNIKAQYINFPQRTTEIGHLINAYLASKKELTDEVVHLLFSANRWEKEKEIIQTLNLGTTLVIDRYCYSGVAFSAAKGLDMNWCKAPDAGLPLPDKVFFLTMPLESAQHRNGYGEERYEVLDFQKKVAETYSLLKDVNWVILDGSKYDVQQNMLEACHTGRKFRRRTSAAERQYILLHIKYKWRAHYAEDRSFCRSERTAHSLASALSSAHRSSVSVRSATSHYRVCLWDSREKPDRTAKKRAWEEIAKILYDNWDSEIETKQRELVDELQKKWKHLRDYYVKEKKRDNTRSGSAAPKKRKNSYIELLRFLDVVKVSGLIGEHKRSGR
ncbi:Thymidylate kinase [Eumeta japonica]|uniref:Thymidylate kinase n=1 Tax=Eumeta variegata TaxID=151549 RepID=A0A4C1YSE4_EUMVA|nr:Thymidylate kinase [Eumeta japonica]